MKIISTIKYILISFFLIGGITSCYDESPLVAQDHSNITRFTFPEGNAPWDIRLDSLAKIYDFNPIYKSYSNSDFGKSWISVSNNYSATPLDDQLAPFYINFLIDDVFYYFNPEIGNKVLPIYWYLVDDYKIYQIVENDEINPIYGWSPIKSVNNGIDYWVLTFDTIEKEMLIQGDSDIIRRRRDQLLYWYIDIAYIRGVIKEPNGFRDGINYKTSLSPSVNSSNYFMKRGFVERANTTDFDYYSSNTNLRNLSGGPNSSGNDFECYIQMSLYFTKDEFEAHYGAYPIIINRYNLVVDHLLTNYGIDIQKMAAGIK